MQKITKVQFEEFWNAVLASDWYVEEGPNPEEGDDPDDTFDVDDTFVAWQGQGEPKASDLIKASELDGANTVLRMGPLYKRWVKAQTTVTLVASFDVPKDQVEEFKARIRELGGKVR